VVGSSLKLFGCKVIRHSPFYLILLIYSQTPINPLIVDISKFTSIPPKNPHHFSFTISEFIYQLSREIIFTNSERGVFMHFNNDTDLYRIIGTNIKHYREQAKLTQVQLAEQAKISISYLSKIEAAGCNKSLSISVLNQIANALDIEITNFFKEIVSCTRFQKYCTRQHFVC
jgi:DNA-binding XRE family transcriptional regulator